MLPAGHLPHSSIEHHRRYVYRQRCRLALVPSQPVPTDLRPTLISWPVTAIRTSVGTTSSLACRPANASMIALRRRGVPSASGSITAGAVLAIVALMSAEDMYRGGMTTLRLVLWRGGVARPLGGGPPLLNRDRLSGRAVPSGRPQTLWGERRLDYDRPAPQRNVGAGERQELLAQTRPGAALPCCSHGGP